MKTNLNIKELNSNSITAILEPQLSNIYESTTKEDIYTKIKNILSEHQIDTQASRRLLLNLQRSKTLTNSLFIVSNSVLAGNGLAVI